MNSNNSNNYTIVVNESKQLAAKVKSIEPQLSSFGGKQIPFTVLFFQEFEKKEMESGLIDVPIYDGVEKVKKMVKGKEIDIFLPKATGKTEQKKIRFHTGQWLRDERYHSIPFLCSKDDIRNKAGEAFQLLMERNFGDLKRNEFTHMALNVTNDNGETVTISTKMLQGAGVKISKCFTKGKLDLSKYRENFCSPLFKQLKEVVNGASGKHLEISDDIKKVVEL